MDKTDRVQFITPPNSLRDKVLKDGGASAEPDYAAMDTIIEKLAQEFIRRLPDELNAIAQALDRLKAEPGCAQMRDALFRRVHDLKGQAGTYDYWMITVIGNDLCRFIEHVDVVLPIHLQVMDYHVQAMTRVMTQKMIGKMPKGAQQMVDTLHHMVGQVLQQEKR